MKYNLLHKYKLEKKISKLEKLERLMYERTVGRGGGDSNAYAIWKLLRDEGPSTSADVKNSFPSSKRDSIASMLTDMLKADCIRRQGNNLVANLDYSWDDVGVIPRTAQQELMNSIRNGRAPSVVQEEPPTRSAREPRVRQVKQNLFSRKFEEVKAAVDAGQDVNQVNDKGQTPLLFAANSKSGNNADIIEYLLTHGADLSQKFKGLTAFDLACKNSNIDAMRAILANDTYNVVNKPSLSIRLHYKEDIPNDTDIILLAAQKERVGFNVPVHTLYCRAYSRRIISKEQYEQIINTILDNCQFELCSSDAIKRELTDGITNTIRNVADKKGILVTLYKAVTSCRDRLSDSIARQLLSLCKEAANGKLSILDDVEDFIYVCRILCNIVKDESFMSNLLNPKFLHNLDPSDLNSLFHSAVVRNDASILSRLVAAKVKLKAAAVCGDSRVLHSSKEITRLATRLIDKNTALSKLCIDDIATYGNEYLINYVIDMGYGEDLLAWCADRASTLSDDMAVVKALKDNGFELPDDEDSKKNLISRANSKSDHQEMIDGIINAIIHDEWRGHFERFITDHPEILFDSRITKAIEDNNTTTSRQLRRRIERLPKNQDVYDF